jgi:PleD family two-component response regulator
VSASNLLAAAQSRRRALILLAPRSADRDPWLAFRKLHEGTDNHHVISLLDRYGADTVGAAFAAGVDDVLVKPLIPAELDARLWLAKRVLALEDARATLENEGALLAEISTRATFHSHRYLQSELANELTRAHRFAHALSVIVAETRNGNGGERGMRSFGQALSSLCRSRVDWIARYTERSYAVVLPETDLAGALHAAGRLQAALAARQASDDSRSLLLNLGVSALGGDCMELAEREGPHLLLDAAEQYLKDAARKGPGHIAGGPAPHA